MKKVVTLAVVAFALVPYAACATSDEPEVIVGDASAETGKSDSSIEPVTDTGVKDAAAKKDAGKDVGSPGDSAPPAEEDAGPFEDCPNSTLYAIAAIASKKPCSAGCDGATECCFRNIISAAADRCVPK